MTMFGRSTKDAKNPSYRGCPDTARQTVCKAKRQEALRVLTGDIVNSRGFLTAVLLESSPRVPRWRSQHLVPAFPSGES